MQQSGIFQGYFKKTFQDNVSSDLFTKIFEKNEMVFKISKAKKYFFCEE